MSSNLNIPPTISEDGGQAKEKRERKERKGTYVIPAHRPAGSNTPSGSIIPRSLPSIPGITPPPSTYIPSPYNKPQAQTNAAVARAFALNSAREIQPTRLNLTPGKTQLHKQLETGTGMKGTGGELSADLDVKFRGMTETAVEMEMENGGLGGICCVAGREEFARLHYLLLNNKLSGLTLLQTSSQHLEPAMGTRQPAAMTVPQELIADESFESKLFRYLDGGYQQQADGRLEVLLCSSSDIARGKFQLEAENIKWHVTFFEFDRATSTTSAHDGVPQKFARSFGKVLETGQVEYFRLENFYLD